MLCQFVHNLGGVIPGWPHLSTDPSLWVKNINLGIYQFTNNNNCITAMIAARSLGVSTISTAEELADKDVAQLGKIEKL